MSTPHIEHFVDERGNFIYRAEFEGSFLSTDEAKELAKYVAGVLDENAKLRELVRHLYICMERQEPDGSLLCANCPYENESNECDYEQRMEELGVDV